MAEEPEAKRIKVEPEGKPPLPQVGEDVEANSMADGAWWDANVTGYIGGPLQLFQISFSHGRVDDEVLPLAAIRKRSPCVEKCSELKEGMRIMLFTKEELWREAWLKRWTVHCKDLPPPPPKPVVAAAAPGAAIGDAGGMADPNAAAQVADDEEDLCGCQFLIEVPIPMKRVGEVSMEEAGIDRLCMPSKPWWDSLRTDKAGEALGASALAPSVPAEERERRARLMREGEAVARELGMDEVPPLMHWYLQCARDGVWTVSTTAVEQDILKDEGFTFFAGSRAPALPPLGPDGFPTARLGRGQEVSLAGLQGHAGVGGVAAASAAAPQQGMILPTALALAVDGNLGGVADVAPLEDGVDPDDIPCKVCRSRARGDEMLLCDGCDGGWHTFCIGLATIPEGDWFCRKCAVARGLPPPPADTATPPPKAPLPPSPALPGGPAMSLFPPAAAAAAPGAPSSSMLSPGGVAGAGMMGGNAMAAAAQARPPLPELDPAAAAALLGAGPPPEPRRDTQLTKTGETEKGEWLGRVPVTCNQIPGVLVCESGAGGEREAWVESGGAVYLPPAFEQFCGRHAAKKWRDSIKIARETYRPPSAKSMNAGGWLEGMDEEIKRRRRVARGEPADPPPPPKPAPPPKPKPPPPPAPAPAAAPAPAPAVPAPVAAAAAGGGGGGGVGTQPQLPPLASHAPLLQQQAQQQMLRQQAQQAQQQQMLRQQAQQAQQAQQMRGMGGQVHPGGGVLGGLPQAGLMGSPFPAPFAAAPAPPRPPPGGAHPSLPPVLASLPPNQVSALSAALANPSQAAAIQAVLSNPAQAAALAAALAGGAAGLPHPKPQ